MESAEITLKNNKNREINLILCNNLLGGIHHDTQHALFFIVSIGLNIIWLLILYVYPEIGVNYVRLHRFIFNK